MPIDVTRRGFLAGLLGATVIAVVPKAAQAVIEAVPLPEIDPFAITAPPGLTYNWITCAVMGTPSPQYVEDALERGWTFVAPKAHPEARAHVMPAKDAIGFGGLILMQKPTPAVERDHLAQQIEAKRRFPMMRCPHCKGKGGARMSIEERCPVCKEYRRELMPGYKHQP